MRVLVAVCAWLSMLPPTHLWAGEFSPCGGSSGNTKSILERSRLWRNAAEAFLVIQTQLKPSSFRHHERSPRRIEYNLDTDILYSGEWAEFLFNVGLEHISHSATRSGHGHGDINVVTAVFFRDAAGIHEPKIDDIDRDFRVVNGLELVPYRLFAELRSVGLLRRLKAESVRIARIHAHKLAVPHRNGVAASQALRDDDGRSLR